MFVDSCHNDSHPSESLPVGQGETHGAVLRWRSGGLVQSGTCHQSLCEAKKRVKGREPKNSFAYLHVYGANDLHTHHLDTRHSFASDERVCVEILFFLLFLRSLLSRSLPGKTRFISEKVLICLLSSSPRPFVSR